jgi:tryptophan-rich sensory protein
LQDVRFNEGGVLGMTRIIEAFDSQGLIGLSTNLFMVWAALAVSVLGPSLLGSTIGGGGSGLRDAPWTPPGWFIGAVWACLYTALGVALWTLNRVTVTQRTSGKVAILVLLGVLVTWTFYAFSETTRWPGLIGNVAILLIALFVVWRLWPVSRNAALLVAPVAVWITIATATILDAARLYGWHA